MTPGKLSIVGTWLVEETGGHTCAGGTAESGGAHEPNCGLEPLVDLSTLEGWPTGLYALYADTCGFKWPTDEMIQRAAEALYEACFGPVRLDVLDENRRKRRRRVSLTEAARIVLTAALGAGRNA